MGALRGILIVSVAILAWYVAARLYRTPDMPVLDPNAWYGAGEPRERNTNVRPFKIQISKEDVADLKTRLALSPRISPSLENVNFTYGVNSAAISVILDYWRDNYNWVKREKMMNNFKHFKTVINGLDVHFLRASPPANTRKTVRPLLMVHGWPGSVAEFFDILPLLITPRPDSDVVFDVICPSIPGYGFSEPSAKTGMNALVVAQMFVELMERLGFDKFYAQGGDWGSLITTNIATVFPERLLGLHLNMFVGLTAGVQAKIFLGSILPSGWIMDPKLEKYNYPLSKVFGDMLREMGYAHIHATKPDTVGVALNSSPQGLAAYILEKFSTWTLMDNMYKKDGGLLDPDFPISLDAMLDNICIYWFTGSITSSMRFYAENMHPNSPMFTIGPIPSSVPTGIAAYVNDLLVTPRNLVAQKFTNIVTYTHPSDAGHFAAMQDPKVFADDVYDFVNVVERQKSDEKRTKK